MGLFIFRRSTEASVPAQVAAVVGEPRASDARRRELDLAERERTLADRERAFAARLALAAAIQLAARARDVVAEGLDGAADQRERQLDLEHMLSPASDQVFAADWPARRHAVLDRVRAKADRASSREDLVAVLALLGDAGSSSRGGADRDVSV